MINLEKIKIIDFNNSNTNLYNNKKLDSFIEEIDLDNTIEEVKTKIVNGLSVFKEEGAGFIETIDSFIVSSVDGVSDTIDNLGEKTQATIINISSIFSKKVEINGKEIKFDRKISGDDATYYQDKNNNIIKIEYKDGSYEYRINENTNRVQYLDGSFSDKKVITKSYIDEAGDLREQSTTVEYFFDSNGNFQNKIKLGQYTYNTKIDGATGNYYLYNSDGNLSKIMTNDLSTSIQEYNYYEDGSLKSIYQNGEFTEYNWNPQGYESVITDTSNVSSSDFELLKEFEQYGFELDKAYNVSDALYVFENGDEKILMNESGEKVITINKDGTATKFYYEQGNTNGNFYKMDDGRYTIYNNKSEYAIYDSKTGIKELEVTQNQTKKYYPNGNIESIENSDGSSVSYHENGNKKFEESSNGEWVSYFKDGSEYVSGNDEEINWNYINMIFHPSET